MARKKRIPIGTVRPVSVEGGLRLRGGRRTGPVRVIDPPGPGRVWIGCDDPVIDVVGHLVGGGARTTPPRPRYETDERHGRTSLTRYAGMDPLEQEIPIKFDGHSSGTSVIAKIRALESLAQPDNTGEPPLVRVLGPSIRHEGHRWHVTRIEEDQERAIFAGDSQVRYVAAVTLTQHVKDELLVFTGSNARGIKNRTERVRNGEDSLHEFAKRVYGDRSKAKDIARANPGVRLGEKLKVGTKLRIP